MDPLKLKSDLIPLIYFCGVKGQASEGQQWVSHSSDCINSQGLSQSVYEPLESCIAFGAEAQKVSISLGKFTFSLYNLLLMPKLKKRKKKKSKYCVMFSIF